jgi:hypothetical protein
VSTRNTPQDQSPHADRLIVLRGELDWRPFVLLLLGERDEPVVVVTRSLDGRWPVLPIPRVSAIVGAEAHLVHLSGRDLQVRLRGLLGRGLAVADGAVRVYWPGVSAGSDPADHPLVPILPDEPEEEALAALRLSFNLTRRGVRQEITLMQDVLEQQPYDAARVPRQARKNNRSRERRLASCPPTPRAG